MPDHIEKGIPGKPKFARGDRVGFSFPDRENGGEEWVCGEVFIVDAYGTFFDESEPSYDVYVVNERWPEGCLYKHIPESRVTAVPSGPEEIV